MKKLGLLVMPLMAVSLLASCGNPNVKEYIVYFDTNGGSPEVERQVVKANGHATDPQIDVKRNGASMLYWSLQDEDVFYPSEFIFKDNKITSDTTLHAIYSTGPIDTSEPLAITCTKGPMTLNFYGTYNLSATSDLNIKWSKDKTEWHDVNVKLQGLQAPSKIIEGMTFSLEENETIYLVGDNSGGFSFLENLQDDIFRTISISNDPSDTDSEFEVSGNVLSLIDSASYKNITEIPPYCFNYLFEGSNVSSAEHLILSCNQLSDGCYLSMFDSCKKLAVAPNLPAMILANQCYEYMFDGCKALTKAPLLPAFSFNENCEHCYYNMFSGCNSLSYVKVGFGENDIWPEGSYTYEWLSGVSDSGVFEWKGSQNPTDFDYSMDTVPEGWTIKHY